MKKIINCNASFVIQYAKPDGRFVKKEILSNFQGCKRKSGKSDRQKPESDHDLRFGPSLKVEVVVDRSTLKKAFSSGIFEVSNLQYHRK